MERGNIQIANMIDRPATDFPIDITPPEFICPITREIFKDPVILGTTGHTFEREAITDWLRLHNTDPLTNELLAGSTLAPNFSLAQAVDRYVGQIRSRVIPSSDLVLREPLDAFEASTL